MKFANYRASAIFMNPFSNQKQHRFTVGSCIEPNKLNLEHFVDSYAIINITKVLVCRSKESVDRLG